MPELDSGRRRRAALTFISRYGTIMGLLAMIVFFAINAPGTFLSRANFLNILSQASLTAIISAGLTFTLVVGEFDLSIGNVASFIGLVVAGLMAKEHLPIPVAVALALLVGVVIGLVNGFLVTKVRINAVIATIGVGTMLTGLGFSYSAFPIAIGIPRAFTQISLGRALLGVPNPVFIMAALLIVMWTILNKTDLGQRMQAVGSNIEAARLSGNSRRSDEDFRLRGCGLLCGSDGCAADVATWQRNARCRRRLSPGRIRGGVSRVGDLARRSVSHRRHSDRGAGSRCRI
jgi:ribose transport system permease protein